MSIVLTCSFIQVSHTREDVFSCSIDTQIENTLGFTVTRLALSDLSEANLPAKSIIVSTIELREPVIGSMTAANLESLKILIERASIILWISGGNLYQAKRPDFAPVFGFARSVMLELPSVKFIVLDIDTTQEELEAAEKNILTVLQRAVFDSEMDLEYLQYRGALHVSRFVPDQQMVSRFREKQDEVAMGVPLKDAGTCQLSIKQVGQMDTIHFVTSQVHDVPLESDFVEVESKILGLNAKVGSHLQKCQFCPDLYSWSKGRACTIRPHRYEEWNMLSRNCRHCQKGRICGDKVQSRRSSSCHGSRSLRNRRESARVGLLHTTRG